jgi:tyrosyl-tRNA synthetase
MATRAQKYDTFCRMILRKRPTVVTSPEKIADILTRGVEDIFVKESLEKKLNSGKQLRVKLGFDPTGSQIHIGRAIVLRKLKAFQDLGHTVVFIAGDFTAQIGDPSDKLEKRPMLLKEHITKNLKDYKNQVGKIIDLKKAEFHFNSTWLKKLGFQEIAELSESFTVQQMSARRNFEERFKKDEPVSVREFCTRSCRVTILLQ